MLSAPSPIQVASDNERTVRAERLTTAARMPILAAMQIVRTRAPRSAHALNYARKRTRVSILGAGPTLEEAASRSRAGPTTNLSGLLVARASGIVHWDLKTRICFWRATPQVGDAEAGLVPWATRLRVRPSTTV